MLEDILKKPLEPLFNIIPDSVILTIIIFCGTLWLVFNILKLPNFISRRWERYKESSSIVKITIAISLLMLLGLSYIIASYINSISKVKSYPLEIIKPQAQLIRSDIIKNIEGSAYKNTYLIGIVNISDKTIKNLQIRHLHQDPKPLPILGSNQFSTNINPGDFVYFELGYIFSEKLIGTISKFITIDQENEKIFKYNKEKIFYYSSYDGGLAIEGLKQGDDTIPFLGQISAENTPTRYFILSPYKDEKLGVLFEINILNLNTKLSFTGTN
jgi:hypothetical protein